MENNKPRTIDEFFIEKYEKLEEENQDLKQELETYKAIEKTQDENIEFWKSKYYELVRSLREDISPQIAVFPDGLNKHVEGKTLCIFKEYDNGKYQYYKEVFNLKEKEGEENE